ncbi:MAG: OsmC family protein [Bacteroidetes bacterium]|nr:OsmC family protein [Bacteroidota bacterium]
MHIAQIIYQGNLRTEATHLKSGNKIITDAPLDNNGKGEAFSPTDLLSTSLGNCMLTIMGILAERINVDITNTVVDVTKIMNVNTRKVNEIKLDVKFPKSYTDKEKQMLENAAKTCPVALSLNTELIQTINFIYP